MATASEKLAQSLDVLYQLQDDRGCAVIKSAELSRTHRERLLAGGFIQVVIKGWYISLRPDTPRGDTTAWYTSFWNFAAVYLKERFDYNWCLSPEQSLLLMSGNWTVPKQLLVRSPKGRNRVTNLPFNTSILDIRASMPEKEDIIKQNGLNIYSLESALTACGADFFKRHATDARTCLLMIREPSVLLRKLLDGGHSVIAGRLAGAFRNIGRDSIADEILETMKAARFDVREVDPFAGTIHLLKIPDRSPWVNRIKLMWHQMRKTVISSFPAAGEHPTDIDRYLREVERNYTYDAYNSLSIEGYQVTVQLIERVRDGKWNPEENEEDNRTMDAMAARGYFQAFLAVEDSIKKIFKGKNAGEVAEEDCGRWYRELFLPAVSAGILKASDLAGDRNTQVYIKGSKHIPLNSEALSDAMPAFFDMLKEEEEASVRAVLGHFIFVYIHPYMDGNGRIGRFLFNAMLASGGYPWTVIPLTQRDTYMAALEKASVAGDITDFVEFLAGLVEDTVKKRPS